MIIFMIILFENLHNIREAEVVSPIILSYISDLLPHNKDNWERRQIIRYHIHAREFYPSLLGCCFKVPCYILRFIELAFMILFPKEIIFKPKTHRFIVYLYNSYVYIFPKANTINFWKVEYKNVFPYAIIAVALTIKYEIEWRMEICCLFYVGKNVLFLAF